MNLAPWLRSARRETGKVFVARNVNFKEKASFETDGEVDFTDFEVRQEFLNRQKINEK